MSVRTTAARAASALLLVACAGGEHRGDSTAAGARAPQPTIEGEAGATAAGATTAADSSGATAAAAPRDSIARPTPLPMPEPSGRPPADAPVRSASFQGVARDTLHGVVAVVGAEPMTEVVLRGRHGRTVRLLGAAQEELRRLSGAEVWVRGRLVIGQTPRPSFDVTRYAVRAVGGVPARDGVLAVASGALYLVSVDGTWHRLPPGAPAALRSQLGARVWVSGVDTTQVASFGVIRPRG